VAGIVLILAALTPLMECFDRWDKNPSPASDTEIHLTAWFVGVGIVLTLAKLVRYVPAPLGSNKRLSRFSTSGKHCDTEGMTVLKQREARP
jgi:hypothetical protein